MSKAQELFQKTAAYLTESMATTRPAVADLGGSHAPSAGELKGRKRHTGAAIIDLDRIMPDPDQPRKSFDEEALDRLAQSLKTKGQLQPIRVRFDQAQDRFIIISGERRYRAATKAGLPSLECVVHEKSLTDDERFELALIENAIREDLNPIEEAQAYRDLMSKKGWNQGQLAEALHVSRSGVVKTLSLLKLPEDIQHLVSQATIPPTLARELARLGSEEEQRSMLAKYQAGGLTTDDVATQVTKKSPKAPGKQGKGASPKKMTRSFPGGIKVTVTMKKRETLTTIGECLREWADVILDSGARSKAA